MSEISVQICHPTNGSIFELDLDDSYTAEEVISLLIGNDIIAKDSEGYCLAIKGGEIISNSKTLAESGVISGLTIRVLPHTNAGGGLWVILGSLAATTQVILSIINLWKKNKTNRTKISHHEYDLSKKQSVVGVRIIMNNGETINLENWLSSSVKMKEFVDIFTNKSSSMVAERVILKIESGEIFEIKIQNQVDRENLNKLIRLLDL